MGGVMNDDERAREILVRINAREEAPEAPAYRLVPDADGYMLERWAPSATAAVRAGMPPGTSQDQWPVTWVALSHHRTIELALSTIESKAEHESREAARHWARGRALESIAARVRMSMASGCDMDESGCIVDADQDRVLAYLRRAPKKTSLGSVHYPAVAAKMAERLEHDGHVRLVDWRIADCEGGCWLVEATRSEADGR